MKKVMTIFLFMSFAAAAFSATIKLKDGSSVNGKVISSNASRIMVEDGKGNVTILPYDSLIEDPSSSSNTSRLYTKEMTMPRFPDGYRYNILGLTGLFGATGLFNAPVSYFGGSLAYERAIVPNVTIGGAVSAAIFTGYSGMPQTFFEMDFIYHPLTSRGFNLLKTENENSGLVFGLDPYIGFGVGALVSWMEMNRSSWDMPVIAGINIWLLRDWALRVQNKFYVMHISAGCRDDLSVGLVFSF